MRISLRTRVFVMVGIVLATSIAVSALLSRRETLIEVRQVVASPAPKPPLLDLAADVAQQMAQGDLVGIRSALEEWERDHHRRVVFAAPDLRTMLAASNATLASLHIKLATPAGDLSLDRDQGRGASALELRGADPLEVRAVDGRSVGWLFPLPPMPADKSSPAHPFVQFPGWVVTTVITAAIALALAFALSRRVLTPVGALTDAVQRMARGDLNARVPASATTADEIGDLAVAFNAMA